MTITPSNPQPGQSYTYTSSYTLDETVNAGKAHYKFELNGIIVSQSTDDLCTDLKKTPTPCPLAKGPVKSTTTGKVPSDIPSGTLTSITNWSDQNGEAVLCIKLVFQEN